MLMNKNPKLQNNVSVLTESYWWHKYKQVKIVTWAQNEDT